MDHIEDIIKRLIGSVFETEKVKFQVNPLDIQRAVCDMAKAYKPDPDWENYPESHSTQYDAAGHRCAYLHKYAMVHTGLVWDIMDQALSIKSINKILRNTKYLTLCSLGSGPGTDILALMFILMKYMPKRCTAYLIDKSYGWSSVFDSIINELRMENYKIASSSCFEYVYLKADLLGSIPVNVHNSIKNADIITMIKFISAAACKKTEPMIENIFSALKPGAIVLYIDNAAGGFYEMMKVIAGKAGMDLVFGPLKHYDYEEIRFKIEKNGSTSLYKTRVTAAVWMKSIGAYTQDCYIEMDCQSSARFQTAESGTENVENEEIFRLQCAVQPNVDKGIRLESGYVLEGQSDTIKLQSDSSIQEEKKSGSCCLIM